MIFGFDFGTTNTLVAYVPSTRENEKTFVQTFGEDANKPIPSVVTFFGDSEIVGSDAKANLDRAGLGVFENTVRSPKTLLGRPSVDVGGIDRDPIDIASSVIKYAKKKADIRVSEINQKVQQVVATIPVSMNGLRRAKLRDAFDRAGIEVVQFIHEPFAALYGYFRNHPETDNVIRKLNNKYVLVLDWGGGTLDITLCLIQDGEIFQVENNGDQEVGGDSFDELLRDYLLNEFRRENNIADDDVPSVESKRWLLEEVEKAKIKLSSSQSCKIYIPEFFPKSKTDFEIPDFRREKLASITRALLNKGFDCLNEVFTQSGIDPSQVSFALGVGGMASMPAIKNNMYELFRERFDVPENSDRLIAQGAAWVAHDRSSLVLARPLELRMPREKVFPLFQAGRRLPFNSAEEVTDIKTMYCADPKDGHANIPLVTTQSVLKNSDAYGKRLFLGALDVKVDSEKPPLFERINLRFAINQDLIFKVSAQSEIMNDLVEKEFYDLQFGIALPGFGGSNPDFDQVAFESSEEGLTFKADVVDVKDYKAIPGEILKDFDPRAFSPGMGVSPTAEQRAEKYSYEPCDRCGKIVGRCECHISNGR